MPNIRQFDNPIDSLHPDDRAVQATVFAARHTAAEFEYAGQQIGSGIAAAGDAYDRIKTQQDLSHGLLTSSAFERNAQTSLQQTFATSDPNDPTVAAKWVDQTFEPFAKDFVSGFHTEAGRQWATAHVGTLRQEWTRRAVGEQALNAGVAAQSNYETTRDNYSEAALHDPTSTDLQIGKFQQMVDAITSNPLLSGEQRAQLRAHMQTDMQKITAAGAMGAARANPTQFVQDANAGKWDGKGLDGEHINSLVTYAESVHRMQNEDVRQAQNDAIRQDKAAAGQAMTALYAGGIGKGPNGTWAPPANYNQKLLDIIQTHPQGVDMAEAHAAQGMVSTYTEDQATGRMVISDPKLFTDLAARTSIPPTQPGALSRAEIFQSVADRKLSQHDGQMLTDALDKVNDPAQKQMRETLKTFIESKKSLILGSSSSGLGGTVSPEAQERYYQFNQAMTNAVDAAIARGQTPTDVIQKELNPASPNYLGRSDNHQVDWMKYYSTGVLSPGTNTNRPLASPAGSSVHPPAAEPGQAATKVSQDQVNAILAGK